MNFSQSEKFLRGRADAAHVVSIGLRSADGEADGQVGVPRVGGTDGHGRSRPVAAIGARSF